MTTTTAESGGRRSGRPAKYPWNDWLDGEEHRLWEGKDFHVRPESFRQQVLNEAGRRGLEVETTLRRATTGEWVLRVRPGRAARVTARGRDWDAIFTRKAPTTLVQGRHFDCKVESMRVQAYQAAARRGVSIKTEVDYSRVVITPLPPQ